MRRNRNTTFLSLAALVAFLAAPSIAYGGGLKFEADLSGAQEVTVPPGGVVTDTTAEIKVTFDDALTEVEVDLKIKNGIGITRAHFHCGRAGMNGPIAFGLFDPGPLSFDDEGAEGTLTNVDFSGADCVPVIGRPVNNIAALAFAMRDGLIYVNVHTLANPAGEVRGQLLEK
jgi:hypothetical protein